MVDWLDEAESLFAEPTASAIFTPEPAVPAPTQLQSLIDQPTRAPTDVELGVAQLRAMTPAEQAAADLEGRKLLFQEGLSFGVLPKVGAAATSLKEALYGTPFSEAFGQAVTEQDILKEYVRQQELEKDNLIFGLSGPELAGGLASPIGRLYTPFKVAKTTPLATSLAIRGANIGQAAGVGAGASGLQTFLSTPGTLEERLAAAGESATTGALVGGGFGAVGQLASGLKNVGERLATPPITLQDETNALVKSIDSDVAKLSTSVVEHPSRSVVSTGTQQVNNIITAKKDLKKAVKAAFEDPEVYDANVPTTGLRNDIDTIVSDWSGGRKTEVSDTNLKDAIGKLFKLEKPKLGQALAAFTTQTPNEVPLGELHKLQIQIGKSLGKGDTFTPDEALAAKLYDYIGNLIDNTPGGEKLIAAKKLSKAFRDAFVWDPTTRTKSPLSNAQRKESEKVVSFLAGGSGRFNALQKAGVDITPITNQLVNEFNALKTPQAKLDWINRNRPVLENAPFWNVFDDAGIKLEAQLGKLDPLLNQQSKLGQFIGDLALRTLAPGSGLASTSLALALAKRYGAEGIGSAMQIAGRALAPVGQGGLKLSTAISRPEIVPIADLPIATVENADKPEYVSGQDLAEALKAQADKSPTLSADSPTELKYDEAKLDKLYKQNNLGTLIINKTKQSETFVPGHNPKLPKDLISSDDEIEIKPLVQQKKPDLKPDAAASRSQSTNWLNEAESLFGKPKTKLPSETIEIGKQNVSIPTGEKYSEPRLVKAVMQTESSLNPKAVSSKGAGGLMQIMPETAKELGLTDRFDPDKNVEAGSRYLKQLENAFKGDKKLALAAYNWGIGRVQTKLAEIKDQGEEPTFANLYEHLPGETKTYIRRVMLNYNLLEA